MKEIKLCKCCKSKWLAVKKVDIYHPDVERETMFYVECMACGSRGRTASTEEKAISQWNARNGQIYDLNDLAKDIHETAKEKGWHEEGDSSDRIPTLLALVHSEVSEALEAYRDVERLNTIHREGGKPEGFSTELADVIIRVLDICALYGIDIQHAVDIKMAYNKTRSHRHGGKRC